MTPAHGVPTLRALAQENPRTTAYMRLRAAAGGASMAEAGPWTPLDAVSPWIVFAVVKAEDPRFFRHRGIHWASLWRAIRGGGTRGGSTLTQQLARNLYLSPERTLARKAREAALALRMERAVSKSRILELYLNVAEWGDGTWGVAQAARRWLGRAPGEAGAFEAALLASLLPAPRRPLQGRNANRAWWVQRYVLFQLRSAGYLGLEGWRTAVGQATSLCRLAHAGVPVDEAVRRVTAALPPAAGGGCVPSVAELVANGCGVDTHVPFGPAVVRWEAVRRADRARRAAALAAPPG